MPATATDTRLIIDSYDLVTNGCSRTTTRSRTATSPNLAGLRTATSGRRRWTAPHQLSLTCRATTLRAVRAQMWCAGASLKEAWCVVDRDEITAEVAARLVAEQFPQWGDLPVTPVPLAGNDNVTFRLGAGLLIRLPSGEGLPPGGLATNPRQAGRATRRAGSRRTGRGPLAARSHRGTPRLRRSCGAAAPEG